MLKRFLVLLVALILLPSAAKAQNSAAIAGFAFYSVVMTAACALFVVGARGFEDVEKAAETEESKVDYARRGFYLDGGMAYANGFSGSMAGPRIHVGYRCHNRFAADLEYEGLYIRGSEGFHGSKITSGPDAGKNDSADSYWNIAYNAKAFILTGRIQPFIVVGFGVGSADRKYGGRTNTDFSINGGAGVDGWLTESLALSLDAKYTALTGGASDLGHLSIGTTLKYMF